ncbi:MAG: hypothetical protein IKI57_02905 [Clostridia bacterium]|nr:hypothetical protein [Clostridia bacterium]
MLLLVKSMRVEKHIKRIGEKQEEVSTFIFNCRVNEKKFELEIDCDTESSNQIILREVKMFSGISYFTKERAEIEFEPNQKEYDNCLFKVNENEVQIKFENLIPTNRIKEKRPVWIFEGESALGKSYLSSMLANGSNCTKYETDQSPILPETITEDMIIVGRKYHFSLKDIKERIYGEHEAIIVSFEKDE